METVVAGRRSLDRVDPPDLEAVGVEPAERRAPASAASRAVHDQVAAVRPCRRSPSSSPCTRRRSAGPTGQPGAPAGPELGGGDREIELAVAPARPRPGPAAGPWWGRGRPPAAGHQRTPAIEDHPARRIAPTVRPRLRSRAHDRRARHRRSEPGSPRPTPPRASTVDIGRAVLDGTGYPEAVVQVPTAMCNRHGLIAGATGTGKTVTLQLLAEQLSAQGVPVFTADIKGDLSGLVKPAAPGRQDHRRASTSCSWRTRPPARRCSSGPSAARGPACRCGPRSDRSGPQLLAKVLDANETQRSSLALVFHYADQQGLPLARPGRPRRPPELPRERRGQGRAEGHRRPVEPDRRGAAAQAGGARAAGRRAVLRRARGLHRPPDPRSPPTGAASSTASSWPRSRTGPSCSPRSSCGCSPSCSSTSPRSATSTSRSSCSSSTRPTSCSPTHPKDVRRPGGPDRAADPVQGGRACSS